MRSELDTSEEVRESKENIFGKMPREESEFLQRQNDFCPKFDKEGKIVKHSIVGEPEIFSSLQTAYQKKIGVWQDSSKEALKKKAFKVMPCRIMSAREKSRGETKDLFTQISESERAKQIKNQEGKAKAGKVLSQNMFIKMPNRFEMIHLT